ncbi:hypothetical protein H4V95_000235 [Arthrobacter sp. CAN_C5]|nr:hypothetical protein [Arthrobacter sp. CAN_C5]
MSAYTALTLADISTRWVWHSEMAPLRGLLAV